MPIKNRWLEHISNKCNPTIAAKVLYIKEMKICPAYILKINLNSEKQIILLKIPKEEKGDWHYLAVKNLSALLKGVTSKNNCLNCLYSFTTKNMLKFHEKVCKNKDFCGVVLSS